MVPCQACLACALPLPLPATCLAGDYLARPAFPLAALPALLPSAPLIGGDYLTLLPLVVGGQVGLLQLQLLVLIDCYLTPATSPTDCLQLLQCSVHYTQFTTCSDLGWLVLHLDTIAPRLLYLRAPLPYASPACLPYSFDGTFPGNALPLCLVTTPLLLPTMPTPTLPLPSPLTPTPQPFPCPMPCPTLPSPALLPMIAGRLIGDLVLD